MGFSIPEYDEEFDKMLVRSMFLYPERGISIEDLSEFMKSGIE